MYIGLGIVLGTALGAAFDNVGLGIALGIVFGAGIEYGNRKKDESDDGGEE